MNHTLSASSMAGVLGMLWFSGCVVPPAERPARTPVRWIMVEQRARDVFPDSRVGDGQVEPGAVMLTLQPLYREDLEWQVVVSPREYFVEVLEITPSAQATPGETVCAKVRVGKAVPGERYRLTAKASRSDVHILDAREQIVSGSIPAVFRFTSVAPGPGGIGVCVARIDEDGR